MTGFTLDTLRAMMPCDLEAYRESGEDARQELTNGVMRHLHTPDGWYANGEYRSEFGGLFPVQWRFTSPDERCHLCLCSPGYVVSDWSLILLSDNARFVRLLTTQAALCPQKINHLLRCAASFSYKDDFVDIEWLAECLEREAAR
ncbi:conjugation system SOS inhibitor PsiB [Cronobacter malonaticus]|jgi:hypothetical protein|nr:conjugation system SOS inhibitor PsiB [Cronobacter malonaticus]